MVMRHFSVATFVWKYNLKQNKHFCQPCSDYVSYSVSKDRNRTETVGYKLKIRQTYERIFLWNVLYYIMYVWLSCDMIMWLITRSLYHLTITGRNQFFSNFHSFWFIILFTCLGLWVIFKVHSSPKTGDGAWLHKGMSHPCFFFLWGDSQSVTAAIVSLPVSSSSSCQGAEWKPGREGGSSWRTTVSTTLNIQRWVSH